ncbi:uncharacterized protein KZ484_020483 [Pholidichthys leucotaenia]
MSSVEHLKEFIQQRLAAAAEEIVGMFQKTLLHFQEEMSSGRPHCCSPETSAQSWEYAEAFCQDRGPGGYQSTPAGQTGCQRQEQLGPPIGLGAESVLKELQRQKKIKELTVLEYRKDCIKVISTIIQKLQEKSPLKYPPVRQVACLDPSRMFSDPEWCQANMTKLVQKFLQDQQLSGGVSAGDVIIQQFNEVLAVGARSETFLSYRPTESRLDVFLHGVLSQRYHELWEFCKKLLLLSHGQATVERGFSINKEVETCNMQEDTMIPQ